VSERPIIFKGESVLAILAGRKTQTRRIVRPGPPPCQAAPDAMYPYGKGWRYTGVNYAGENVESCPYGVPGDRLWVRESWWTVEREGQGVGVPFLLYDEEWEGNEPLRSAPLRPWGEFFPYARSFGHHPSIHMPRVASRLTLEVTGVRVQRLQEISEEDATAEGVDGYVGGEGRVARDALNVEPGYWHPHFFRQGFRDVWGEINGKRAPWESNPWVWALTFAAGQGERSAPLREA